MLYINKKIHDTLYAFRLISHFILPTSLFCEQFGQKPATFGKTATPA